MKKYLDAHCHLHLMGNPSEILEKAREKGVKAIVCNGVKLSDWPLLTALCAREKEVYGAFGIHPMFSADAPKDFERVLLEQLTIYPDFGIGECGLDNRGDLKEQERLFQIHLEVGFLMKRPVYLHCVHAFDRLLHILKKCRNRLPPQIVLHSYSGNQQTTNHLLPFQPFFSFSIRFFKNQNPKKEAVLKNVPLDRILIESDAPDVLETPDKITAVAKRLSDAMRIDESDLTQIVFQNTERLLSWKKDLHA